MRPTEHELKEFANALQLSISTEVKGVHAEDGKIVIEFDKGSGDDNIRKFAIIVSAEWTDNRSRMEIRDADKVNWQQLTLFLLLTRLNDRNMAKFVEFDPTAKVFTEKLGLCSKNGEIENATDCSKCIFAKMKEKGMTMREMASATGLTEVSVANFKAGKDVKLSNFIKIARALGLQLKLKESK